MLTGLLMEVASWLDPHSGDLQTREQVYWLANAGMLMACTAVIAVCVSRTHRRRPWDALLVALAPAFALTATINWDLLAVALTAAAMLMWSRSRPLAAGVLLGLATAAKLYPVLLLGPLLVLCLRAGRWRAFWAATGGAAASWLVVNVPVMCGGLGGLEAVLHLQPGAADRLRFALADHLAAHGQLPGGRPNTYATLLMVAGLCRSRGLALPPRRPRFAQLAFLVVAAFILTNKVYSPQYVLWLIPLAALARPRWRDFLMWQACEVMYFLGIWQYLAYTGSGDKHQGLPTEGYQLAIALHLWGRCTCARWSSGTLWCRTGTRSPGRGRTIPRAESWTGAGTRSCWAGRRHPPRHAAHAVEGPRVEWGTQPQTPGEARPSA